MSDPDELSTLAAVVGRQSLDLNLYAAFLQNTLAAALPPQYLIVDRKRSLFGRGEPAVVRVAVQLGERRFVLQRPSATAPPEASIAHEVGGIVLKTEVVPLGHWAEQVAGALADLARSNADAAAALARITSYDV